MPAKKVRQKNAIKQARHGRVGFSRVVRFLPVRLFKLNLISRYVKQALIARREHGYFYCATAGDWETGICSKQSNKMLPCVADISVFYLCLQPTTMNLHNVIIRNQWIEPEAYLCPVYLAERSAI